MTRPSYALLGITAVAAVVRFATLDLQSFDHDEAVTAARVIRPGLFDTLSEVGDSATLAVAATAVVGLALLPLAVAQEGGERSNLFADQSLSTRAGKAAVAMVASEEPGWLGGDASVDRLHGGAAILGVALAIAAVALVARRGLPEERRGVAIAGLVGAAAFALPFALGLTGLDFAKPRNLVGCVVPFLVAGGVAFGTHEAKRLGTLLAVGTAALFAAVLVAVYVSAQMQRPDWRTAAEAIGPPSGPRVLLVPRNGDDVLVYYLDARWFKARRFPRGIRTREIAVLSKAPVISPPRRGFRLVQHRRLAPSFVLRRYRSPRAVRILPSDVAGRQILKERSQVLADGLER